MIGSAPIPIAATPTQQSPHRSIPKYELEAGPDSPVPALLRLPRQDREDEDDQGERQVGSSGHGERQRRSCRRRHERADRGSSQGGVCPANRSSCGRRRTTGGGGARSPTRRGAGKKRRPRCAMGAGDNLHRSAHRLADYRRAASSFTTSMRRSTSGSVVRQLTMAGRSATLPSQMVVPAYTRPSAMMA